MLTADQALQLVNQHAKRLPSVQRTLSDALGLVLTEPVVSDIDSPPHDKAMMDGYAVLASDRSETRTIIERIMAGDVPQHALRSGEAAQVMTGAPVPQGATSVVPVEKTELVDEQTVRFDWVDPPEGKHIMPQGSSMRTGQQVAPAETLINSTWTAALAEAGAAVVDVAPRPIVSILATGNELTAIDVRPGPGQIRNSNGPLLVAATTEANATPRELPVGRDDQDELTALVAQGLEADVLVVTGGVSAGVKDLVPAALQAAGATQVFHKVALKPGKPIWFGTAPRPNGPPCLMFGLPGNPVSSLVCFRLFVAPALAVLAGRADSAHWTQRQGELMSDFAHRGGRETFRPAVASVDGQVELCNWRGSADLAGMASANCLVRLPVESAELAAGDTVNYLPLD